MKIRSPKDFRYAVLCAERLLSYSQYLMLVNFSHDLELWNPRQGVKLDAQINRIINHRNQQFTFEDAQGLNLRSLALQDHLMRWRSTNSPLREQLKSKRIRKQDEALQVGADSSQ